MSLLIQMYADLKIVIQAEMATRCPGNYRTRAIITLGLYIFYPIFEDHFFVCKEVFSEILSLCMASIQERVMMARAYGNSLNQRGKRGKCHVIFVVFFKLKKNAGGADFNQSLMDIQSF